MATKPRVTFTVLLGAADGSDPVAPTDAVNFLLPAMIGRYQGGQRLDFAEFVYDLSITGEHVQNNATPTGFSRQVEIRVELGEGNYRPVFWGDLTMQDIGINRGGTANESVFVTASIYPYHFGNLLFGPRVYDTVAEAERTLLEDIWINPLIDGVIEGNRSSARDGNDNYYLWGDPESFRTAEAEAYQAESLSAWSLAEVLEAIIWRCNPDETFFKNPTDLTTSGLFADAQTPENERLPRGRHLPFYLDLLLPKYGYEWRVELEAVGGVTEKRIKIFRRGAGTEKTLRMQPYGSTLLRLAADAGDPALAWTNLATVELQTDVGNAVNVVYVDGGVKEREVTIELYRGWAEADDALTADDLKISESTSQYHSGKDNVWRLFAANEGADYCGTRTTVQPIPGLPRDWSTLGCEVVRRRQIEDCLTYGADGQRRPPFVEWSDDNGATWQPVPPEWSYNIFQTQMAIRFVGDTPPAELIDAGDVARIRVTCTLVGDERITGYANSSGNSPNSRTSAMHIDKSDKFFFRQIQTSGSYASELNDGTRPADTRDDSSDVQTFAQFVRASVEPAQMDGRFVLFGIDTASYEIGDLLTNIDGREISLNRNSADAATTKPLQIVGIEWREDSQSTILITSPQQIDPNARRLSNAT